MHPSDHVKITRSVPSPTRPTSSAVASAIAALPACTREENVQKAASDPPAEPPAEKKDSAVAEEPGDGLTETTSQDSRSTSPGSDASKNRASRPVDVRAEARQADAERGPRRGQPQGPARPPSRDVAVHGAPPSAASDPWSNYQSPASWHGSRDWPSNTGWTKGASWGSSWNRGHDWDSS